MTVCSPWLCLFLYIKPLPSDKAMTSNEKCPCQPLTDLSPTYFSVTRYFCQLLECGDNPEFTSHNCFDYSVAGLWCVVQLSVLMCHWITFRPGYSIFLLTVPIEQLPDVFIEKYLWRNSSDDVTVRYDLYFL